MRLLCYAFYKQTMKLISDCFRACSKHSTVPDDAARAPSILHPSDICNWKKCSEHQNRMKRLLCKWVRIASVSCFK